ncbi:MAG TPA: sigma-54 dependent transcriptional regulator, partial [Gemmatimonadales bacterium]|nr:sigma-54 dependent transcriptional regulator [Gemmatimonadales bacterium]
IDDDVEVLRSLGTHLERAGYEVSRELGGDAGLATFDRLRPDVVLLDLGLPGMGGAEVLAHLKERGAAVLLLIEPAERELAVGALGAGAENFLVKPVDASHLVAATGRAADKVRLRRVNEALLVQAGATGGLETLGGSPAMQELAQQVRLLAASDRTLVLIEGELGTGKGVAARLIHELGPRGREPFVEVNCSGQTASQLEASLFGHEKGALPDARDRRQGLLEIADRGTILLSEIADLPPELQPRLLKVLETRAFRRMGGTRDINVDVRLIAATSRTLSSEVESGRFREDLYYRLSVMPLRLPPVRDRSREDRLSLLMRLIAELRRELPEAPSGVPGEVMERLLTYNWPGNVREMRNVLERAMILGRGLPSVVIEHLPGEFRNRPGIGDRRHTPLTLDELERQHIERTLRHHNGNRTRAAQELGISRATLINKIKRYTINV